MSVNNASDIVADPMIPVPYRIVDYTQDLSDTFTITLVPEILVPETLVPETLVPETLVPETLVPETLVPEDIKAKQQFLPGQFNMLYVFGVGEAPISISGDTGDGSLLVHTIKAVGAVTKAIQTLRPGDVVGIEGRLARGGPLRS